MVESKLGLVSAVASGSSSGRATMGAEHVGTGRQIVGDETYQFVWNWAVSGPRETLLAHEGAQRLRVALKAATTRADTITGVRGVRLRSSDAPTWEMLGPPPPGPNLRGGRYNARAEVVLYLADTWEGVAREFRGDIEGVWIQQYSIPGGKLRIADFSPDACPDNLLKQVFWWAETAGDNGCPASAAFSQAVAEIVREAFDGMVVPGVRGDHAHRYRNVVMFRPSTLWRTWSVKDIRPVLLSEAVAREGCTSLSVAGESGNVTEKPP